MNFIETAIEGVFIIEPRIFADERGYFFESYSRAAFEAAGLRVVPIRVMHGKLPILGYRIGNMAYLTDVKYLPETEYAKLEGLELLILTALRQKPHPTHESLD